MSSSKDNVVSTRSTKTQLSGVGFFQVCKNNYAKLNYDISVLHANKRQELLSLNRTIEKG